MFTISAIFTPKDLGAGFSLDLHKGSFQQDMSMDETFAL